ncbi:hypothetical protein Cadr_000011815 [Camelus dromedarius]|uniref:Uncharacterized protein n=1 Tax=Camelus dromedarius TaxID=9838 RepID=A0A5N4DTB5_CAMDR|nr:hypothetical protein Cadr_000011815 [Camelus dromedarius]
MRATTGWQSNKIAGGWVSYHCCPLTMWCLPHCFLPRTWDSAYCGGSKNNSLTLSLSPPFHTAPGCWAFYNYASQTPRTAGFLKFFPQKVWAEGRLEEGRALPCLGLLLEPLQQQFGLLSILGTRFLQQLCGTLSLVPAPAARGPSSKLPLGVQMADSGDWASEVGIMAYTTWPSSPLPFPSHQSSPCLPQQQPCGPEYAPTNILSSLPPQGLCTRCAHRQPCGLLPFL